MADGENRTEEHQVIFGSLKAEQIKTLRTQAKEYFICKILFELHVLHILSKYEITVPKQYRRHAIS